MFTSLFNLRADNHAAKAIAHHWAEAELAYNEMMWATEHGEDAVRIEATERHERANDAASAIDEAWRFFS